VTLAICIACGAQKVGGLSPCHVCGHDPAGKGLEHEARSLLLTDHYASPAQLEVASAAIKSGATPEYDEAAVREIVSAASAKGQTTLVPSMRGCGWLIALMLLACLAATGLMVWLKA
jgi:hypothetical protein